MTVRLIGDNAMNQIISHLGEVKRGVHREAEAVGDAAEANLRTVRGTTRWRKIHGPGHLTSIEATQHDVDSTVDLVAPNPMAIEFGHAPSGVFGEDGALGHIKTKAPEGLYILHKAAGFGLE